MAYAPQETYFENKPTILGGWRLKENDNFFEFSVNDDPFNFCEDFPHKVWVSNNPINDSGYRYAIVKKTVAYICVDEDEFGLPVLEKWDIKNHRLYPNYLK